MSTDYHPPRPDEIDWSNPLNVDSPQAQGLVAWWPLWLDTFVPSLVMDRALMRRYGLTPAAGAAKPTCVPDATFGRAFNFASASSQWARNTAYAGPVTAPMSLVAWIKPATNTGTQFVMTAGDSLNRYAIYVASDQANAQTRIAGSNAVATLESPAVGLNWGMIAGVFSGSNARKVFWNRSSASNATDRPGNAATGVAISSAVSGSASSMFNGLIAEARIYNRALSDAEVLGLWLPETRFDLVNRLSKRRLWPGFTASPPTNSLRRRLLICGSER